MTTWRDAVGEGGGSGPQGGTAVPGELPETADVEAFAVDEANPDGADVVAQVQKDTFRPQQ